MAAHTTCTAKESTSRGASRPAAHLVPLTLAADDAATTGQPTLFLVHAIGGSVHTYATLAKSVKDVCSVVGIEAFGLYGEHEPVDALDEIVERYVAAVRAASPHGPYRLGGWSMGGIVAFEMARRLEQDGAEVAFVAILDSPFTLSWADLGFGSFGEVSDGQGDTAPLMARFAEDVADSLGWSVPATGPAVTDPLGWLAETIAGDGREREARGHIEAMRAELQRRFLVFRAHAEALAHYAPSGPITADLLLLTPDRSSNVGSAQRWAGQTRGQAHHAHVHGDHYTFLRAPVVGEVAALIRTASRRHEARVSHDG
ncbi:alpha/beta fold hydrolase [Streptomyces sp. NPDC056465]|uniref:thioesterase domain-containing protein n=1 Tax=unclassified Streptomyces TaxID=2593676 RepID=UPI0036BC7E4D